MRLRGHVVKNRMTQMTIDNMFTVYESKGNEGLIDNRSFHLNGRDLEYVQAILGERFPIEGGAIKLNEHQVKSILSFLQKDFSYNADYDHFIESWRS